MTKISQFIIIIGATLFAGSAVLLFSSNLVFAGMTVKLMNTFRNVENPKDPFEGGDLKITNHRLPGKNQFKPGYVGLARIHDINAQRFVRFSTSIPLKDLLTKGEELPSSATENVFVKSRAIYYAREECERLLTLLADKCEVAQANGKVTDKIATIRATLRFVQKAPFGKTDRTAPLSFESISTQLTKSGVKTSLRGALEVRNRLYRKASDECNALRSREGNCAISGIYIQSQYNTRSRDVTVSGRGSYAFLQSTDP